MPTGGKKNKESTVATASASKTASLSQSSILSTDAGDDMLPRCILASDLQSLLAGITAAFTGVFNTCVEKLIDSMDKKLSTRLDIQEVQDFDLNKKIDKLEKLNHDLMLENKELQDSVKHLTTRVDASSVV